MTAPLRLAIRLTPRGGRDAVDGWAHDERGRPYLKVRVSVPPVDGAANAALVALIARRLKRPGRAVRIVGGETARLKQLEIEGIDAADIDRAFGSPSVDGR